MTDQETTARAAAPGWPGIAPTWTSSAKDMVTTALGPGRVWATVGFGIINEVYWPSSGFPQLRDLGFVVVTPSAWHEIKRVARYQLTLPRPYVPLPRIVHTGDGYELELEISPDRERDVLLIAFRLTGAGAKLHAMVAPHLAGSGRHNNARAGRDLTAWKAEAALCLVADCGFARTSAGFVGASDGWQDFFRNGRMTWAYDEACDGNVALTGELSATAGVLALGFASTAEGARTLARSSLAEGFPAIRTACAAEWETWAQDLDIPDAPAEVRDEALLSAAVLKTHECRTYPGAVVASLSIPWGTASDSPGGYHLVWTRDAVETGLALLAVGCTSDARRMLAFLIATQRDDGSWSQNYYPDGRPFWTGVQLDEVAFPILLAAKLAERDALDGLAGVDSMIARAAAYLVRQGPASPQDRWEENAGISPFTLGVVIAGLVAAADTLPTRERDYLLSLADCWNERLEGWTYVESPAFMEDHGVDGYYVRIAAPLADGGLRGRIDVRNRIGKSLPASALIGMEFLYLPRLGLRDPRDSRIQNTVMVADSLLKVETPHGVAYRRYNEDGYGEHEDGSPFDGTGIGRAWPLLTGERGHLDLQLGIDPLPYLEMMARMTGRGGLIPEQVWDGPPIPERMLEPGKPTGSAMPLVWAHGEFLKLLAARRSGRPLERLASVERRYGGRQPSATTWHWRRDEAFTVLPPGRALVIEEDRPFQLHCGYDGWQDLADLSSVPLGLGMHGVRFEAAQLAGRAALDFTVYFSDQARWEGSDHHVTLGRA